MKSSNSWRQVACWFILISLGCVARPASSSAGEGDSKIQVLIIDGFSNHDWQRTTQIVRNILEPTGRFDVRVSTSPETQDDAGWDAWRPEFADVDVVIQNCNSIGNRPTWPRRVERQLEQFVRDGGGLYVLHSANNAFAHWPQYNRMIGLGWRKPDEGWAVVIDTDAADAAEGESSVRRIAPGEGRGTYHGPRVDSVIHLLGEHPIHRGFPRHWKTPSLEVYKYARGPAEAMTVLSFTHDPETQLNWPTEWTIEYGKGRVYNSTFGHVWRNEEDAIGMRCVGARTTMIRALQWLAGGQTDWPVPEDFPTQDSMSLVKSLVAPSTSDPIRHEAASSFK